jgi:hypothetical protein
MIACSTLLTFTPSVFDVLRELTLQFILQRFSSSLPRLLSQGTHNGHVMAYGINATTMQI